MDRNSVIVYPAIFTQEEGEMISVVFPDLTGCFSQGTTFEDAFIKSQEALAIHYHENKGQINKPSSMIDIKKNNSNEIVQMVSVDLNTYILKKMKTKYVKKTLTIPEWLDDLSKEYSVNYSNILKEGLIGYLKTNPKVSPYDKMLLNN